MRSISAIVLAAGKGTRMKSKYPKVLANLLFRPMLYYVADNCMAAGVEDLCFVTGFEADAVEAALAAHGDYTYVRQTEQRGTGHAVQMAAEFLQAHRGGDVLVLCGDAPCLDAQTIEQAFVRHRTEQNAITIVTAVLNDPAGYGRIVRKDGAIECIVERADCTPEQLLIHEINAGAYWFDVDRLLDCLSCLTADNAQGEYYLTDTVSLTLAAGHRVGGFIAPNPAIVLGVNSRADLLAMSEYLRQTVLQKHMENGVEFVSTEGVVLAPDAVIGADTVIYPGTIVQEGVVVGEDCILGPNTLIQKSTIGDRVKLNNVQCYQSRIHDDVDIGPFVHIRPNSEIHSFVHIGDFVEVKNSSIGAGTGISHLTYVGDSDVGKNVNFGCGVVTVNYDGVHKHRCAIGDGAFIGCNTNLVAPVTIGENGYTAAGSTITKDVPAEALGIARARQENKEGFSTKKLAGRKKKVQ